MKNLVSRGFRLLLVLTFVVLMPLSAYADVTVVVELEPGISVPDEPVYQILIRFDNDNGEVVDVEGGVATRAGNPIVEWDATLDSRLTPTAPATWYQWDIPALIETAHWFVEEN